LTVASRLDSSLNTLTAASHFDSGIALRQRHRTSTAASHFDSGIALRQRHRTSTAALTPQRRP
jgi:hypothetical protein